MSGITSVQYTKEQIKGTVFYSSHPVFVKKKFNILHQHHFLPYSPLPIISCKMCHSQSQQRI